MVGVLSNDTPLSCPYYDDLHIENIESGVNSYDFTIPATHEMAGKLEANGSVIIKDLDNKLQVFKIKDIAEDNTSSGHEKTYFCEHLAISELLHDVVRPVKMTSYTLEQAVNYVLLETEWKLGESVTNVSQDIEFTEHITVLEALLNIVQKFDAEIKFEVIFKHGKIQKKLIHVAEQLGSATYKVFSYRKDLDDVVRKENSDELVTALICVGKGNNEGDSLTLANFTGNEADFPSPKDVDFLYNTEALQRYGKNGKHLFGIYNDSTATNQLELYRNGIAELKNICKPKITYECKVLLLERLEGWDAEKVRVGDKVRIFDYSFNPVLLLEARVLELKRSYTDAEKDEIVLGDYRPLALSNYSTINRLQAIISKKESLWEATSHNVEITSTEGLVFKGGQVATTLKATVFAGGKNVTNDLPASAFRWSRTSNNPSADVIWNNNNNIGSKTITVTNNDLSGSTTFNCSVTI